MLRLRLRRVGRKHDPSFRIVVTENTAPLKGKYLESIGFYNAVLKKREVNHERAKYWLSKGVQPTDVVHNILVSEGVIDAPKIAVHKRSKKQSEAEESQTEEAIAADDSTAAETSDTKDDTPAEEAPKDVDTPAVKDTTEKKEEAKEVLASDKGDKESSPDTATDEKKEEATVSAEDKKDTTAEKSKA